MKKSGFTLVELVITITILVILSTIAFVSFQSYTRDSRDANRLSTLNQIASSLNLSYSKNGSYPTPENSVSILASGAIIGYQGTIGNTLFSQIGLQSEAKDPLDKKYYSYRTNQSGEKYQLLALLENDNLLSYAEKSYAGYEKRALKGVGDKIGILLDTSNTPLQELSLTGVDILKTSTSYKAFIDDSSSGVVVGSGNTLSIIKGLDLLSKYDPSLKIFYDMESTSSSGQLLDLTGNNNSATPSGGVTIGGSLGNNGNATYFDGSNDFLQTGNIPDTYFNNDFTIIFTSQLVDNSKTEQAFFDISPAHIGIILEYNHNCAPQKYTSYLADVASSWNKKLCGYGKQNGTLNTWDTFVVQYSKSLQTYRVLVNGKEDASFTGITSLGITNSKLTLGYDNTGIEYLRGYIDDFKLFNRVLSDAELKNY